MNDDRTQDLVHRSLPARRALALALAWAFAPRPVEVEVAPVTQGRFESTIDEDGKTRLADRYVVSAPLAGRLARITLREGDAVAAGAVVATLTPVLPRDARRAHPARTAGARRRRAGQRRSAPPTRIERAKVALRAGAQRRRAAAKQLAQQGFIAPTKLDSDRLAALAAQKELDVGQRRTRSRRRTTSSRRAPRCGAVRRPGRRRPRRGFAVRAPAAGRVLRVLQTSEATVALGTPLLETRRHRAAWRSWPSC